MGRPRWLGAGVVVGVVGTVWVEQRLRRRVNQLGELASVSGLREAVTGAARRTGATARDALDVAKTERSRRADELWRQLGGKGEPAPPHGLRRP